RRRDRWVWLQSGWRREWREPTVRGGVPWGAPFSGFSPSIGQGFTHCPALRRAELKRLPDLGDDGRGAVATAEPDLSVLACDLDVHGPRHHGGEGIDGVLVQVEHFEFFLAGELALVLLPPDTDGAGAVAQHRHPVGAVAALADAVFVRHAEFDPVGDVVGEILFPQIRLV